MGCGTLNRSLIGAGNCASAELECYVYSVIMLYGLTMSLWIRINYGILLCQVPLLFRDWECCSTLMWEVFAYFLG